jgi:hypothetical protein
MEDPDGMARMGTANRCANAWSQAPAVPACLTITPDPANQSPTRMHAYPSNLSVDFSWGTCYLVSTTTDRYLYMVGLSMPRLACVEY